ncbi:MAG: bifunctional transaldolase/phosoglucose isomerase [Deferrisomatales bacterium]
MTRLHDVAGLGQSIWIDTIRRSFLASGELERLVADGVRGVTSNPTIFDQAIRGSDEYDPELQALAEQGKDPEEIYEALAVDDIRRAADLLLPVYRETQGADGFASLEVSPALAHDTAGTVAAARRLFAFLGRPNVMIKVPATPAGVAAVQTLIGEGISINVTLIFSLAQYEGVAEAYLAGLEALAAGGGDLGRVASVASFFVSRVDTAVEALLGGSEAGDRALRGRIAVDNARLAYARFRELFRGERWERLARVGARVQRPLWASTGTKNPAYPDTLYVDALIGPDTVNTVPPATLAAFLDHGTARATVGDDLEGARERRADLATAGVDLDAITRTLLEEGLDAFARSYASLLGSVAERRERFLAAFAPFSAALGALADRVAAAETEAERDRVVPRLWARDHTLWHPEPDEIADRLGWLGLPEAMEGEVDRLEAFADEVRSEGITRALVLGMGGSSLAPEVFGKVFGGGAPGAEPGDRAGVSVGILDTTDPGAVLAAAGTHPPAKTLYLVATKSGTTVEPLSLFRFFHGRAVEALGAQAAGRHFAAVTDPGSRLAELAREHRFREVFLAEPNVGGRYAALTHFGLVPAALAGADLRRLLERARQEARRCGKAAGNPGARLGAILAEAARAGRDKVTLVASGPAAPFGDWAEQLLAESTGKDGRGLVPVVGEPVGPPEVYGGDRLFVHLGLAGDAALDGAVGALEAAGHPVVRLDLDDLYDLGGQFFRWEFATAVAAWRLGVHPFDQPDVEAAKVLAREMATAYQREGALPEPEPALRDRELTVFGDVRGSSAGEALRSFLGQGGPGAYVALHAYLQPCPGHDGPLRALQAAIRDRTRLATTLGYGPRFLHSTGQLHKGGPAAGLFVQLTADDRQDAVIPDAPGGAIHALTFGVLKRAQALGDARALADRGRPVLRIHLGESAGAGLRRLKEALS